MSSTDEENAERARVVHAPQPLSPTHYARLERLRAPSLRLVRESEIEGKVLGVDEFFFLDGVGYACEIDGSYLLAYFVGPTRTDNSADIRIWNSPEKPRKHPPDGRPWKIEPTGQEVWSFPHTIPDDKEHGERLQGRLLDFIRNWIRDRKPETP
jgi:hypothetical protein